MIDPVQKANEQAREECARAGNILKSTALKTFDESKGAKAWRATRAEFVDCVTAQGPDYAATLVYTGVQAPYDRTAYDAACINSNDVAGRPALTMWQCRQESMLALMRSALERDSESYRLIRDGRH